jgi:hypothetical protein
MSSPSKNDLKHAPEPKAASVEAAKPSAGPPAAPDPTLPAPGSPDGPTSAEEQRARAAEYEAGAGAPPETPKSAA